MSFFKHFATFSGFTLLSRSLGFIRDILIAYKLGATSLADIFFVAFRLPNIFRSLFAEGAFSSAFVPLYAKQKDSKFLHDLFAILLAVLVVFCIIMQLIMPFFMQVMAPGFAPDSNKFEMTVFLARCMFPYLITISLVALLGGVLQSQKRFAAIALVPVVLNICMIFGLTYLSQYTYILYALAFSVILAGLLQLLLMITAVMKTGQTVEVGQLVLSDKTRFFFRKLGPAVFGAGILQISTIIDTLFASTIPGGVAYLYYADRLMQLPLALIGISLGNVLLPVLSQQIAESNLENVIKIQNKTIRIGLILCIPASAALYTLANTAVSCLFAYGVFSDDAITKTAHAVQAFATALPAFVIYKIIINNYFARGDTKTPALVSFFCLIVNVILNIILIRYYQHVGIVIATSIANWLGVIILIRKLRINNYFRFENKKDSIFVKILFSTACMVLATQAADIFLQPLILGPMFLRLLVFIILAIVGLCTYFASLYLVNGMKFFKDDDA